MQKYDVQKGMTVRSSDGDKLGKIIDMQGDTLIIEKGIFFPKDYTAKRSEVTEVNEHGAYLRWGTNLVETNYDALYGEGAYGKETASPEWSDYAKTAGPGKETRIPVNEEQIIAEKKGMQETGRVRVHKTVKTEEQHFSVPVRREEVTVERVKGSEAATGTPPASAFQEGTETFPVREEQVEITKRPVLKEEVRVKTHEYEEQRPVSGKVRKEDVQVEKDNPK